MQAFVGKEKQALYREWGQPDKILPTANSGQEWIYGEVDHAVTYNVGSYDYTKTRVFFLDKNGVVTGWRWKGL